MAQPPGNGCIKLVLSDGNRLRPVGRFRSVYPCQKHRLASAFTAAPISEARLASWTPALFSLCCLIAKPTGDSMPLIFRFLNLGAGHFSETDWETKIGEVAVDAVQG